MPGQARRARRRGRFSLSNLAPSGRDHDRTAMISAAYVMCLTTYAARRITGEAQPRTPNRRSRTDAKQVGVIMTEVVVLDEFAEWFEELDGTDREAVAVAIDVLEVRGVTLGFPQSSAIKGSKYPMRELRVQAQGKPIRVLYCFDPKRQAVIILGAHKTGDRFYDEQVPHAERLYQRYLDDLDP